MASIELDFDGQSFDLLDVEQATDVEWNGQALDLEDVLQDVELCWDGQAFQINAPDRGNLTATYVTFTHSTPSPLVIKSLATNQIIVDSEVVITVAFDDPAATVELGRATAPTEIFAGSEVKAKRIGTYASRENIVNTSPDTLVATIAPGSATVGSGYVVVTVRG